MLAQRFRKRRPAEVFVEAIQVTQQNGSEVEAFCGGESYDIGMAPGLTHHVDVPYPGVDPALGDERTRANVGDYVIASNGCFFVLSAEGFAHYYEAAPDAGPESEVDQLRESLLWALTWIIGEGRMPADVAGLPSDQEAFDKADKLVSASLPHLPSETEEGS